MITMPEEVRKEIEEVLEKELEKAKLAASAEKWVRNYGVQHRIKMFAKNTDLNRPRKKLRFEIAAGGGSYTDGSMVRSALSESWFERPKTDWVRFMKFVTSHEMGHINWSDFGVFSDFQARAESYFDKKHGIKGAGRFAGEMLNITEDGRIERAMVNALPGLQKYMKYANGVEYESFPANQLGITPLHDFRNISLTLSKVGLLPNGYDKRIEGTDTDVAIKKAMPHIVKAIRSTTAKGCADATWDLIVENEEFLAEAMKPFEIDEDLLEQLLSEDMSSGGESESSGSGSGPSVSSPSKGDEEQDDSSEESGEPGDDSSEESSEPGDETSDSHDSGEDDKASGSGAEDSEEGSDGSEEGSDEGSDDSKDGEDTASEGEDGEEAGDGSKEGEKKDGRKITINPLNDMEGEADYKNTPSMGDAPQGKMSAHFGDESDLEKGEAKSFDIKEGESDDESESGSMLDEIMVDTEDESMDFLDKAKEAAARESDRIVREKAERQKTDVSTKEINGVLSSYKGKMDYRYTDEVFEDNGPIPAWIEKAGRGLRRDLKEIFLDKRGWTLANQRSGMLDESQLYRAGSGLQQTDVFIKRQIPEDSNWVVSVLVDNSGSMRGNVHDEAGNFLGPKTKVARQATSIVEIALNGLVPLKIARFDVAWTRNYVVQHAHVRGWEQRTKEILSWNSTDDPGSGNADAMSIGVAVEELKKRPEAKKLLLVLSDGLPAENTPDQVKKVIEESRKDGIKIVGLGFGPEAELHRNAPTYRDMYGKDLVLTMPDGLSKELVKVLRATIARGG